MSILHRIEVLPGAGRYAITFRRGDGAEQTAVLNVSGAEVTAAEASLPAGWALTDSAFAALADAVRAVERARHASPQTAALADVAGGWDVLMGNVVLDADGVPTCTAHGPMMVDQAGDSGAAGAHVCAECGARAVYASA